MKDLSEVASISGKGGLYKILKPGRTGVILESLDDKKTKIVTGPNHKVSVLAEISLYTTTEEGSVPLDDIFVKIHNEFGDDPGVDGKSTPDELMSFIEYIVPEFDTQRVYPSDIKKLVNWYHILLKEAPELLEEKKEKEEDTEKKVNQKANKNHNTLDKTLDPEKSSGKKKRKSIENPEKGGKS